MVLVELHLKVAPDRRIHVLKTIHSIIGPTNAQTGCLFCETFSNTQNDDELVLLQKWDSQESLNDHIRSEEFRKVLAAMDSACEPPEIFFNSIASTAQMEMIEKVI